MLMLCLPLLLACFAAAGPDDPKDVGLVNPGFEEGWWAAPADPSGRVAGRVAKGWSDNSSWADVRVTYGVETANPHRGQSSQRITLHRIGSGAVQFTQGAQFRKGRAYAFSVWMRGRPGTSVSLMLRRQGA